MSRLTIDDLLNNSRSENFKIDGLRIIKKKLPPPELYASETDLKRAAADLLSKLPRCRLIKTDNNGFVKGGRMVGKTREPGMADQHLCICGLFVALEAKMPGKDLDPKKKQPEYRDSIIAAGGIHITYHSLFELTEELKKHRLLPKNFKL